MFKENHFYSERRKKRALHLTEWEFGLYRKDRGEKNGVEITQRCEGTRACPLWGVAGRGGGGLLHTSCRVVNRCRRFPLCYPSAPASGHKWICRLTFQGAEQQMISSSKAKDKETKAPGFCRESIENRPFAAAHTPAGAAEQTASRLHFALPGEASQSESDRDPTA